jgi:hypothetical protein
MDRETHELQKDPPEGSREVIDRELERQSGPNDRQEKKEERKKEPDTRSGN